MLSLSNDKGVTVSVLLIIYLLWLNIITSTNFLFLKTILNTTQTIVNTKAQKAKKSYMILRVRLLLTNVLIAAPSYGTPPEINQIIQ